MADPPAICNPMPIPICVVVSVFLSFHVSFPFFFTKQSKALWTTEFFPINIPLLWFFACKNKEASEFFCKTPLNKGRPLLLLAALSEAARTFISQAEDEVFFYIWALENEHRQIHVTWHYFRFLSHEENLMKAHQKRSLFFTQCF